MTTSFLNPGWISSQFDGKSNGCIPTIRNPFKLNKNAGNICARPLNPGRKILCNFIPARVFNINASVFFTFGNFLINFNTIGGKLKPCVGKQKPIKVFSVKSGFVPLSLGVRILRTETAAMATMAGIQAKWGDV